MKRSKILSLRDFKTTQVKVGWLLSLESSRTTIKRPPMKIILWYKISQVKDMPQKLVRLASHLKNFLLLSVRLNSKKKELLIYTKHPSLVNLNPSSLPRRLASVKRLLITLRLALITKTQTKDIVRLKLLRLS